MHNTDDRIVIALSKFKLTLITGGAILFVLVGIWLFGIADTQTRDSPLYLKGVSVLAVGFFGLCGIYGLVKLFDGSPGLVLDREGVVDNSSALAVGRVPWRDIHDVEALSISGQHFLALVVLDPEKYLGKGNILRRLFVRLNYKLYRTPICISANALEIEFEDLEKHIHDFRQRYDNA